VKFWLHPRNLQHYTDSAVEDWFNLQRAAGLELTYTWRAESSMLEPLKFVLQKLKAVGGTLGILISPDSDKNNPLSVLKSDDDWWVDYYTKTYAPIIAASGVKVGLFHFDKESWKPEPNWSVSVFRESVKSRQAFHEFLSSKLLPEGHPAVAKVWYGQNWVVPGVTPSGRLTGSHAFNRLPDDASKVSNYVNMYWPNIEASMNAFMQTFAYSATPSGRYCPELCIVHHWCGVVKNWELGEDTMTPPGLSLAAHRFWGSFYRQLGLQHVVVYASTNPVLPKEQWAQGDAAYLAETRELFTGACTVDIPSLSPAVDDKSSVKPVIFIKPKGDLKAVHAEVSGALPPNDPPTPV
jgi:hypothetical protein